MVGRFDRGGRHDRAFPLGAEEGLLRRRPVHAQGAERGDHRLRLQGVRRRRPLRRSALRHGQAQVQRHQLLLPERLSRAKSARPAKFRFLARIYPHLVRLKAEREFVLVGDINIAHQEIDLKNWKSNQKNSGFLPEERAWLTKLFDKAGLVDVFRTLNQQPEQYTWWSNRGQAWAKNVGWRLDYHLATPGIAATAKREQIVLDPRFSDHAPLVIDYEFKL